MPYMVVIFFSCLILFSLFAMQPVYGQELLPNAIWGNQGISNGNFKSPSSVAVDSAGNVYVADIGNNRIQKFSGNGTFVSKWGTYGTANGSFNQPQGIAIIPQADNKSNNILVADTGNNRIQKFSGNGTFVTKWGTYGISNGNFKSPSSVAVDSAGNVYVADIGNNRVQLFTENGTFITQWGRHGSTFGNFKSPSSVAVDSAGNVYVADIGNNRIQKFSGNGTFVTKWGTYGISNGNFKSPSSVAVDSAGHIYVVDKGNNRVQLFTENGTFITQWGRHGSTFGNFKSPSSVAVDSAGNVYVADIGNNRIQKFSDNGNYMAKWGRYGSSDPNLKFPSGITINASSDALVADTGNNRIKVFNVRNISSIQQRENVSALNLTSTAIPPVSVSQNASSLAADQAVAPSPQKGDGQELLTYTNDTYGISIQYPQDWAVKDNYRLNPNDPYITVVSFFAPPGENLTLPRDEVSIYIDTKQYTTTLAGYLERPVILNNNTLEGGWENLQIIEAEQNSTLAKRPAYKAALTYKDEVSGGSIDRYLLDTGTPLEDKMYVISYWAHPRTYSEQLPTVQKMIDSFEILVEDSIDSEPPSLGQPTTQQSVPTSVSISPEQ